MCASCYGPNITQCHTCIDPYKSAVLYSFMGTCVCYGLNDGSLPNYFLDTNLNVCVNPCPSNP
jgi:hypothetical protein